MNIHHISPELLSLSLIDKIVTEDYQINLSEKAKNAIVRCREYLDQKIGDSKSPLYGINTGFGYMQNVVIPSDKLTKLQHNLLLSHACGTGELVPQKIVKLMLLLKIQSLAYGNSGISLQTVERLIYMYNHNVLPVIYTQGSLGASGDLAPLAHLALPLIGEGKVWLNNKIIRTAEWYAQTDIKPLQLQTKEGLALINGTQFMAAYGVHILLQSQRLSIWADII
ncbi:MAG: aromatic amino acid ammonia-lyase, partial [Daejeonella sp.]